MTRIALALSLLASLAGCPLPPVTDPPTPPTVIQQIEIKAVSWAETCALPAIAKLALQVLPEVVLDLVSGNFSGMLAQLVATLEGQGVNDALAAVTCAIVNVGANARASTASSTLPTVYANGLAWLTAHPGPGSAAMRRAILAP